MLSLPDINQYSLSEVSSGCLLQLLRYVSGSVRKHSVSIDPLGRCCPHFVAMIMSLLFFLLRETRVCWIFTVRVRSTREGNVLTRVCVSVYTCRGGQVPQPGLDGGGGYHILGLGLGVPQLGLDGGGVTPSQVRGGGYPTQVWMVGGYPGTPPLDRAV